MLALIFLLLLPSFNGKAVEGPGKELPVDPNSETKMAWEFPMEHRKDLTILPKTSDIPGEVLEQLGVDIFFSLWFVFLNEDISRTSEVPFTILAPINFSKTNPEVLLNNENLAEEVIINHIILGEAIRPESLMYAKTKESLGGRSLSFKVDNEGEIWVNDVRILGWTIVDNGVIFALEDYLFTNDLPLSSNKEHLLETVKEDQEEEKFVKKKVEEESLSYPREYQEDGDFYHISTNKVKEEKWVKKEKCRNVSGSELSFFKNVIVCTEEFVPVSSNQSIEKSPKYLASNFLEDFKKFLDNNNSTNSFREYFTSLSNKSQLFENDTFYSAIIPTDEAFRLWYPIDWGFNPFDVKEFADSVVKNSFIKEPLKSTKSYKSMGEGVYDLTYFDDFTLYTRDGLRIARMKNHSFSNHGVIYFVDRVPFVNHDIVLELRENYGYLENGPLIQLPYYESQFLSHAFEKLSKMEQYSYMAQYMGSTEAFGDFAQGYHSTGDKNEGYTLFVPRDDAFWRLFIQDVGAPDPFLLDEDFRLNVLKGHLAVGRYYLDTLDDGQVVNTINNNSFTIQKDKETGKITLNDQKNSNISILNEKREEWVYDLGNIIFIDKVLFVGTSDIIEIMESSTNFITTTALPSVENFEVVDEKDAPIDLQPKFLEDIDNLNTSPKIIYVNNKRVALLQEQEFDSLFSENPE